MCGIIAITGNNAKKIPDSTIQNMLSCLLRRGPDDKGFVRFNKAVVGQTRLSIVDLAGGHQPMKDNQKNLTLVFNGEIYGYKETREKLKSLGHTFNTNSDTEVILKAYTEYGKDCLNHLDGMFAFALWDEEKQELFIARDRFGKKPFYYTFIDDIFVAASEIKSIFATHLTKGIVDSSALHDYLTYTYIPPYKTIYSNIKTLPPAHAGIVKNGKIETWQYWKLEKKPLEITYEEAKQKIKELFDEAVKKRMVADVEIGSLLSGGVDSTLITKYAQSYSKKPIKTFSVGYAGEASELPFALTASKTIGTEHYTQDVFSGNVKELREFIEYFDEPHSDSSDFPQHLISKLASSKVKVALTGDGADELFMGYGWYQKYWHTPRLKRLFKNPYSSYREMIRVFNAREIKNLLVKPVRKDSAVLDALLSKFSNPFEKINACDLYIYLPGQLLTKLDRTSMMHSLEIRSPFLDTKLAEFVYNLPIEFKLSKTENKIILKDILADIFPKEFVYRKKRGFGAPIMKWIQEKDIANEMRRISENAEHPLYKYISHINARKVFQDESVQVQNVYKKWTLFCLALWFESHNKYHE